MADGRKTMALDRIENGMEVEKRRDVGKSQRGKSYSRIYLDNLTSDWLAIDPDSVQRQAFYVFNNVWLLHVIEGAID